MAEGRGERTVGSGHLIACFLGIVVLCCVFFILGYEMGRAQFERGGATVAAKPATPAQTTPAQSATSATPGWPSGNAPPGSAAVKPAASAPPPVAAAAPAKRPEASTKAIDASLRAP